MGFQIIIFSVFFKLKSVKVNLKSVEELTEAKRELWTAVKSEIDQWWWKLTDNVHYREMMAMTMMMRTRTSRTYGTKAYRVTANVIVYCS